MKIRLAVMAAALVVLGTAACGSDDPTKTVTKTVAPANGGSDTDSNSAPAASSKAPAEGSYTEVIALPNGLTAQLTTAKKTGADSCSTDADDEAGEAAEKRSSVCVLVQVTLRNKSKAPVIVSSDDDPYLGTRLTLLAGEDQYELESANYLGASGVPDPPRRLVPGSSYVAGDYFRVPKARLSALALEFAFTFGSDPDSGDQFRHTFTDVQKLLN